MQQTRLRLAGAALGAVFVVSVFAPAATALPRPADTKARAAAIPRTAAALATAAPATATATTAPPTTSMTFTGGNLGNLGGTLPGGTILQLPGPDMPGLYPLEASRYAVTVRWYDRSTNETAFVVYRRDAHGNWLVVHQVPTRNMAGGGDYSWVDTDTSQSGQCYMIAAINSDGAGDTSEECTVRPDPARFPQSTPDALRQWFGLSATNDGTGWLQTSTRRSYTFLTGESQTWGVNLNWDENPWLWKVEAQGGPHLMTGQAVALRVWGGGWLKYGNQTWGVDLQLSDTPSYEWHVLAAKPGTPLGQQDFALWNASAHDYLVFGDQTFGVNLNWYQKTQPQSSGGGTTTTLHGVKTFVAYNCTNEQRPLGMWVADLSAGTSYTSMGTLDSQWGGSSGGCPQVGQPWSFSPPTTHEYLVVAVDYAAPGCDNDPTNGPCQRSETTIAGDPNGQVVSTTIG